MSTANLASPELVTTVGQVPEQGGSDVWPDGLPSVAIDIELGHAYSSVDVDPYQLGAVCEAVGLSDETRTEIDIEIARGVWTFIKRSPSGYFNPRNNSVRLFGVYGESNLNRVLPHELRHAYQYNQLPVHDARRGEEGRYTLGRMASYFVLHPIGNVAMSILYGYGVSSCMLGEPVPPVLGGFYGIAVYCLYHWGYTYHPSEVDARASEPEAREVIQLTPRTVD